MSKTTCNECGHARAKTESFVDVPVAPSAVYPATATHSEEESAPEEMVVELASPAGIIIMVGLLMGFGRWC